MKRLILFVIVVTLAMFGCKRKEHAQMPAPLPAVVAPTVAPAPAAAVPGTPPAVAEPVKAEPTPGSFAAKKAAGQAPEVKPASFAKKTAKPAAPKSDAKEETGAKKSFAKKKVQ